MLLLLLLLLFLFYSHHGKTEKVLTWKCVKGSVNPSNELLKFFGSTQIRTVIKGSRVLYTSHYTIEPSLFTLFLRWTYVLAYLFCAFFLLWLFVELIVLECAFMLLKCIKYAYTSTLYETSIPFFYVLCRVAVVSTSSHVFF